MDSSWGDQWTIGCFPDCFLPDCISMTKLPLVRRFGVVEAKALDIASEKRKMQIKKKSKSKTC
jgi:hypothetical protein